MNDLAIQLFKYQQGFDILMEYYDSLPDKEKRIVHLKLCELGL